MNRFMVWIAFGPWFVFCTTALSDEPEFVRSSPSPIPSGVQWHSTLESGWAESRRRDLPMVIYITSENCHYCDAMKRDTWQNHSLRGRIARGFVAIRLTPRRNSRTLARIDLDVYPTTLIGMPQGKVVAHRTGYQPPEALHQLLNEIESVR